MPDDRIRRPEPTVVSRVAGRLRVVTVRYRLGRWLAAGAAALTGMWAVSGAIADAEATRVGWGSTVDVVTTRQGLRAGDAVTADTVELTSVPIALVPAEAVTEPPVGARVTSDVGVGEILVESRLSSRAGSAASIALPAGSRGVQLDRSEVFGEVGDVVELHALISGSRLARAVIVHADEATVTVAVPVSDVGAVVDSISQGGVVSVLVP